MLWYQLNKTQVENELETNAESGLAKAEVVRRLSVYGLNQLPEQEQESLFRVFLRQFASPLIYVLLVCVGIILYLGEGEDAFIILVVLLFNAVIGSVQEGRSQHTLQSLKRLSFAETTVVRDGKEMVVPEHEIVPGDVMVLQEGQKVTADARVIFSSNLSVDESALTGESGGVPKRDHALSEADLPASSQSNMIFKGTNVLSGNGRALVTGTGLKTEIGKISQALMQPAVEIPLQRNIKKLSKVIVIAVGVISVTLFAMGMALGRNAAEMFSVVVSLAVSMIPEGLPLVLTLILVTGVWRMSKRNALVKKLQAVEALGQARVLAVDKTGTITKNEMVIKRVLTGGRIFQITGNGYEPKGIATLGDVAVHGEAAVGWASKLAGLVSNATVIYSEEEGKYKVSGDPTEAAMTVFAEKFGNGKEVLLKGYRETGEIPFDSKTKFHAVFYSHEKEILAVVAGAPEVVLASCVSVYESGMSKKMTPKLLRQVEDVQEDFSNRGLRVVAFAYKKLKPSHKIDNVEDLVFAGLFGIEDQVRPEASAAVRLAQKAGLKVVMITGDHKVTARAIAREAGIYREGDEIVSGDELRGMSESELTGKLGIVSVFSRITPEDKMMLVNAYRKVGLIVAMTGDGVNDAPPLVAADLGVAMGKIGTEVAKEAADIVLLDDNLSSIVAAIEEGRAMHRNIEKALLFLFSTSLGELLTISAAIFLQLPMPILAVQILWLNLITDPLIGMSMALDSKEPDLLEKKVEKLPKYFVTKTMLAQMGVISFTMAAVTLFMFLQNEPGDYGRAVTFSLTLLAVMQWYNGFNCHSGERSVFSKAVFSNAYLWLAVAVNFLLQVLAVHNPYFQRVLKTAPLSFTDWLIILALGFSVIAAEELRKFIYAFLRKNISPKNAPPSNAPAIAPM